MEMFFTIKLCTYAKLNCFQYEQIIYIKMDLALNNLQRLICHQNQTKPNYTSEINKMSRFTERTDIILGNGLTQQAEFKF